jgi:hypothetical protein
MPDPERLGGLAWTRRTRGALTPAERRRLLASITRTQIAGIAGRIKLVTGRAPRAASDLPEPPDSAFATEVEQACREQSGPVRVHSYRTWCFGHALAALDDHQLEPEQFWAAALLHDFGIEKPVEDEDFTIRSADRILATAKPHGIDANLAADAVCAHATPGVTVERDGALGTYVQAGALLDLAGLRLWDVAEQLVDEVTTRYPRDGKITPLVRAEARAVPKGRFALLVRSGGLIAMQTSPLRK